VRLHVNIDHVATVRNARGTPYPDPVDAARVCLDAGAHGITAHLREDRRHIRDEDVERLRGALRATFNLEMAATEEMVGIAESVHPDVVTLVPERREERTTEGGLEVVKAPAVLAKHVEALGAADIKVSLFIAPDLAQIDAARKLGVEQIELHTGEYAHAFGYGRSSSSDLTRPVPDAAQRELARLAAAAAHGRACGLEVAAGHGLTTRNVVGLVAIPELIELNIGHAIVADAVFLGLPGAVRAMAAAIAKGRPRP
jgi:pyridoxine 5-phosphate synthase